MKKTIAILALSISIIISVGLLSVCSAQPYGTGLYNYNLPYGSQTTLSIATSGNVNISITPTIDGVQKTGTSNITVTSTDIVGYKLYIRSKTSTNMDNLGATLPASANVAADVLAVNTWGYNTDASNNFIGMTLGDTLIRSLATPTSGDITTVTYGIKLNFSKPAGKYTTDVVYTAVPQTY